MATPPTCLFCTVEANFTPPSTIPHTLGAQLQNYVVLMADPLKVSDAQIAYLDQHFSGLQEGVIKVPEARFYMHGDKYITDPDLLDDDTLRDGVKAINPRAANAIVRNRQTTQDEEDIARRFVCWAINTKTIPSTVLSSYDYGQYLSDMGKKTNKPI